MTIQLQVDISNMESAVRGHLIVQAADLLGRNEYLFSSTSSTDHVIRQAADMILHIQKFTVNEAFVNKVVRRNQLTVQFMITGGYKEGRQPAC